MTTIDTFLGCQTVAGSGRIGATDGPSESATFSFPYAVLPLPDNSALVSDTGNDTVRHVSIDERGRFAVRRVGAKGFTWMRPRGQWPRHLPRDRSARLAVSG